MTSSESPYLRRYARSGKKKPRRIIVYYTQHLTGTSTIRYELVELIPFSMNRELVNGIFEAMHGCAGL